MALFGEAANSLPLPLSQYLGNAENVLEPLQASISSYRK